ncbi:Hypothetical_protein [Hexamita inflata]|uniref:Hypothetical_protein n=1 Tax=Hexamita inflata TaxID=28002 RepID=A0AA86REW5_9EUKA|nr:Hypothetical protein HINF_LOCUS62832 [Hexamita inflata]
MSLQIDHIFSLPKTKIFQYSVYIWQTIVLCIITIEQEFCFNKYRKLHYQVDKVQIQICLNFRLNCQQIQFSNLKAATQLYQIKRLRKRTRTGFDLLLVVVYSFLCSVSLRCWEHAIQIHMENLVDCPLFRCIWSQLVILQAFSRHIYFVE